MRHRQVDGFGTPENLTRVNADLTIGVGKAGSVPTVAALSFLPTAVRFAGMPSPRYWEMEDGKTDFGRLDVNTTDLARLLLAEYMLLFSNDWCVVPLELAVGTFTRIQGLLVTDVFGEQTLVRPADRGRDSDWQRWSMYRLNGDDSASMGLLVAPALMPSMRSPAVEQVRFLRDEMANMNVGGRALHRVEARRATRSPSSGRRWRRPSPVLPRRASASAKRSRPTGGRSFRRIWRDRCAASGCSGCGCRTSRRCRWGRC